MTTLYDVPATLATLTYMVAGELKTLREGTVTTASISAPVDTLRAEASNYWRYGPFWVLNANNGSAPQGEYQNIASFGGGTMTLAGNMSATIPVGARYAIGRARYPLDIIVEQVNAAYQELGHIPQTDVSLVTLVNTTQYTIPQAAREVLLQVWVQSQIVYPAVKGYIEIPHGAWRQELNTLYMPQLSAYPYIIKLVYAAAPSLLVAYSDTISDYVHAARIVYKAAANVLMWRAERISDSSSFNAINQRVNYFLDQDQKAKYDHPIHMPKRRSFGALAGTDFTGGNRDAIRQNVKPDYVRITPE